MTHWASAAVRTRVRTHIGRWRSGDVALSGDAGGRSATAMGCVRGLRASSRRQWDEVSWWARDAGRPLTRRDLACIGRRRGQDQRPAAREDRGSWPATAAPPPEPAYGVDVVACAPATGLEGITEPLGVASERMLVRWASGSARAGMH
jgi:hypothetical protein